MTEHVPLAQDTGAKTKQKKKYAFPGQLNPVIYTTLFSLFVGDEQKAAIHLNANVCQSLAVYDENEWQLHCWETDESLTIPGVLHAASELADWDWNEKLKVSSS